MSDPNNLLPLGTVDEGELSNTGRRIEWMSKNQALYTIILYAICNVTIILCIIFGPPYFVSQRVEFAEKIDKIGTYRFSFDFTGLQYFIDFLTLDVYFNRSQYEGVCNEYNLSFFCHASLNSGNVLIDKGDPISRTALVQYASDSADISERVRLFAKGAINFDTLHSLVMFKSPEGISLPGYFEWTFADPAHSIVEIFLRVVIFIISFIVFIRLFLSDFSFSKSPITMKMMFLLDILLIFGADPFYLLSFFTDSPFFSLFDNFFSSFLLTNTFFVSLIVLLMKDIVHRDVSKIWLLIHYIPFLVMFLLLYITSAVSIMEVNDDPLMKVTPVIKGLTITKMVVVGIYTAVLVYGIFTYKTDVPNEKPSYSIMSIILLLTVLVAELYTLTDPYLNTDKSMQTFSFLAVATYILFFNFINWPTDSSNGGDPEAAKESKSNVLSNVVDDI